MYKRQEHKDAEKSQWQVMKLEQQQEIAYQSDDTVASDVGILHDGKSPFAGGAAAKAVKEVRQPVFVQATGDKQACEDVYKRQIVGSAVSPPVWMMLPIIFLLV